MPSCGTYMSECLSSPRLAIVQLWCCRKAFSVIHIRGRVLRDPKRSISISISFYIILYHSIILYLMLLAATLIVGAAEVLTRSAEALSSQSCFDVDHAFQ